MSTREYLIKDFKKEHARKYAKTNTKLSLFLNSIEDGALALLNPKSWSLIKLYNVKLTSSQADELTSVNTATLEIDTETLAARDLVKFLKPRVELAMAPASVSVGYNFSKGKAELSLMHGFLDIVETAVRDRAFFDENYLILLKALNDTQLTLPDININIDLIDRARMLTELISDEKEREAALMGANPYQLPALDISPNSAVLVAVVMEIMASSYLKYITFQPEKSDRFTLPEIVIRFALIMFENTPARVVAEGLALMLVSMALKRMRQCRDFTVNSVKYCSFDIMFPDIDDLGWNLMRGRCEYDDNFKQYNISYDEFFKAANKRIQNMADRCVEVAKTLRDLFPSKNLTFDINSNLVWDWTKMKLGSLGIPPYIGAPVAPSATVSYYISTLYKDMSYVFGDDKPGAVFYDMSAVKLSFDINLSNRFVHIAADSKYYGLFDKLSIGLGSDYAHNCLRTVVADETFKKSNWFSEAVTPATVHLGTFLDTMLKEYTYVGQSGVKSSMGCPAQLTMFGVDTNGLSKSKTALKAVIADNMLGFNLLPNYFYTGESESILPTKAPEFEQLSGFVNNPYIRNMDRIVTLAGSGPQAYTTRYIELTLADSLTIEYDDLYPIFELLDEVTKIVKYLSILSLNAGSISMRQSTGNLLRMFPRMLNPSNSMSKHAFGGYSSFNTQKAINYAIRLYSDRISSFRLKINIPTTCMLHNRLTSEIRRRVKISDEYSKNPSLLPAKDVIDRSMFRVEVVDNHRNNHMCFNDMVSQEVKISSYDNQVVVGFDKDGCMVTRGMEYYDKFVNTEVDSSMGSVRSNTYNALKKLYDRSELTEIERSNLEAYKKSRSAVAFSYNDVKRGSEFKTLCISSRPRAELSLAFDRFRDEFKLAKLGKSSEISVLTAENMENEIYGRTLKVYGGEKIIKA